MQGFESQTVERVHLSWMLLRQARLQSLHLSLGSFNRDTALQTSHRLKVVVATAAALLRRESHGAPGVYFPPPQQGMFEASRHHADNCDALAINSHSSPNDVRVAAKPAHP